MPVPSAQAGSQAEVEVRSTFTALGVFMLVLGLIAGNSGSPVAYGEGGQGEPTRTVTATKTPGAGEAARPETSRTPVKNDDGDQGRDGAKEGAPCGPGNTFK